MAAVSITASSVEPGSNASFGTGVAGEAFDAGDWLAFDTDGLLYKAEQADVDRKDVVGIAVSTAAAAGQLGHYAKAGSDVDVGSVVTQGVVYVLGTDGVMEEEADLDASDYVVICAVAVDGTTIRVVATPTDIQHP
jgi:hypothetical protein